MNVQRLPRSRANKRLTTKSTGQPLLTLFTVPKPFIDPQVAQIQKNALRSWAQLSPSIEVILFGDDYGIEDAAKSLGIRYGGPIAKNQFGTPLLSDTFAQAHELAGADVLMYSNSDVIFQKDLLHTSNRILDCQEIQDFVAFGRRHDLHVDRAVDLALEGDRTWLDEQIQCKARRSSVVCKEYFMFRRGIYRTIPEFAVGRGNWDNWMIYHARQRSIPVINTTETITALHQCHNYRHLKTSRLGCYVTCPEARENQRLAGGRHLVQGSCGTWRMTADSIEPIRNAAWNGDFWRNLGTFSRMILAMPFER